MSEEGRQIIQNYHAATNFWTVCTYPFKIVLMCVFLLSIPVCGLVCGDCAGCVEISEIVHGEGVCEEQ